MTTDHLDRPVDTRGFPVGLGTTAQPINGPRRVRLWFAAGLARTAVTVALAVLAILVLLPAAIASQAATGI